MFAIIDNNSFIGFIYVIIDKEAVYIYYIAISDEYKGKGFGGRAIQSIKEKYNDKVIFFDIEALNPVPKEYSHLVSDCEIRNMEQRIKRHKFHLSQGFIDFPYQVIINGCHCNCMGTRVISAEMYRQVFVNFLGPFSSKFYHFTKIE